MEKKLEKVFFEEYRPGGIVDIILLIINQKFNLDWHLLDDAEEQTPFSVFSQMYSARFKELIKERFDKFDENLLLLEQTPLIDEIRNNILECKTEKEKKSYLYSLILEFKDLSALLYPENVIIPQIDQRLQDLEKMLVNHIFDNTKDNSILLEDISSKIKKSAQEKKLRIEISKMCNQYAIPNKKRHFIENTLGQFILLMHRFSNHLDVICLENGIDLLELQNDCGVWLMRERDLIILEGYVGSRALMLKYINELPKQNSDSCDSSLVNSRKREQLTEESHSKPSHSKDISLDFFIIHKEKDKVKEILSMLFENAAGQKVAIALKALENMNIIEIPPRKRAQLYNILRDLYGNIGSDQSINNYLTSNNSSTITPEVKRNLYKRYLINTLKIRLTKAKLTPIIYEWFFLTIISQNNLTGN